MNVNPNDIIQNLADQNSALNVEVTVLRLAVEALEAQVVELTENVEEVPEV